MAVPGEMGGDPRPGSVHHLLVSISAFQLPICPVEASGRIEGNEFELQSLLSHILP